VYLTGSTSRIIILPEPTPGKERSIPDAGEVRGREDILFSKFSWPFSSFCPRLLQPAGDRKGSQEDPHPILFERQI